MPTQCMLQPQKIVLRPRLLGVKFEWNKHSLNANGIDMHYYRSKLHEYMERPTLVYLHGLTKCGNAFISLFQDLIEEFDVILPDSRGCGETNPIPKGSFTMPNLVSDAIAVIRHVSPNKPVLLVGHSMGAAVAARVSLFHPSLIRGVALEDPPWLRLPGDPINEEEKCLLSVLNHIHSLKALSQEEFDAMNTEAKLLVPPAITHLEAQRLYDIDNIEPTLESTNDEITDAVLNIQIPMLLMTGEIQSGAKCKPSVAREVLSTCPESREVNFPGGDHHLYHNKFLWSNEIRSFFKGIM